MHFAIFTLFFLLSKTLRAKFAQDPDSLSEDGVRFLATFTYPYKTEVCKALDPVTDYNVTEAITVGVAITKSEIRCLRYFELDISTVQTQHLVAEVTFENISLEATSSPLFQMAKDRLPYVYYNTNGDPDNTDDEIDLNGYYNRKPYHYLFINKDNLTNPSKFYFSIYNFADTVDFYQPLTLKYTIKLTPTNDLVCPRSCSNNGRCEAGKCICNLAGLIWIVRFQLF